MSGLRLRFRLDRAAAAPSGGGFALDVDLDLPRGGITALCGHSGSGKTTCLRVIAGLERVAGAFVTFGDEVWQDDTRGLFVPSHRRRLGYVFQEASLFPHMTVRGNLEFGRKRVEAEERRFELETVATLLGLDSLLERSPAGLSGGERQRAAIARALLASPRLLLMDEPLAALDFRRKQEILPYLERLHETLSIPLVYVSHAPDEVARLADHLVLLDGGKVAASGPLNETLARADLPPVFAGDAGVVLDTVLVAHEADALSRLHFEGGSLLVGRRPEPIGTRLRCRILARDCSLARDKPQGTSILNLLPAEVKTVGTANSPGQALVQLHVGPTPMLARITLRSVRELGIVPGERLWLQVKGVALLG
ncbi:molybdenum ABC transporter ATP-binding protein [Massilia aerilata]|uniref:Molybdenum ABC transporter ATP-binding protein n=1 Tax=Massilia aerilata TaxID=453817 RepID=A0ABW0RYB0_9BURK